MAPQKRGEIPPENQDRLTAAMESFDAAEAERRAAVTAALLAGGSLREVAAFTGFSSNTVERWGREGGWPNAEQSKAWADRLERNRPWREMTKRLAERDQPPTE